MSEIVVVIYVCFGVALGAIALLLAGAAIADAIRDKEGNKNE